jgi:superfamily II DNA helicase RecQ
LMRSFFFFPFSAGAQALPSLDGNKSRFGKEKLNSSVSVSFSSHFPFLVPPDLWSKIWLQFPYTWHNAAVTRLSSWVQDLCFHRYAICNEKTLQKIAKSRPSTEARLRNIDGVNQVNTLSIVPSLFSVAVLEMGLQNSRVFVTKSPNFVSIYRNWDLARIR